MFSLLMLTSALAADPMPEPVELKTPTGTIYGGYDIPEGKGPWPLVIVHAGSGPTDRDGNNSTMKNNSLKLLGESLRAKGYAVLRFDKRGIAASAKALADRTNYRIEMYADDVTAWVRQVRTDPRFTSVAFIGHSEGSLIGSIAAQTAKFDAFVSLCGMGRRYDVLLIEQVGRDNKQLGETTAAILASIAKGEDPSEIPPVLKPLFPKAVFPYLRSCIEHDPAKEIRNVACPLLIVSGTTDIQVTSADADALREAMPKARLVRIANMNHMLREFEKTNKAAQIASYMDGKLPLHSKLIETLSPFLKDSLTAK